MLDPDDPIVYLNRSYYWEEVEGNLYKAIIDLEKFIDLSDEVDSQYIHRLEVLKRMISE